MNVNDFSVLQMSIELSDALKSNHIRFAHWKGNFHLNDSLAGRSDLELLVLPNDRNTLENVLENLNFKKVKSQNWSSYPQVEDWIGFDSDTGNLLHLHTHYALVITLSYGRYIRLPWLKVFFENLKIDDASGWPIPEPALEAINLLIRLNAKIMASPQKITEIISEKEKEVRWLLSNSSADDIYRICNKIKLDAPVDLEKKIQEIVKDKNREKLITLSEYFFKQLPASEKDRSNFTNLQSLRHKYYLKAWQKFPNFYGALHLKKTFLGRGKIIALVGSDGSGKSSLSNDLTNWITCKIDAHYFYFGKRPFLKSYKKRYYSAADIVLGETKLSRIIKKLTADYYYAYISKHKAKLFQLAQKVCDNGSIAICDRFPQKDIDGMNDGPKLYKNKNSLASEIEMKYLKEVINSGADIVFRLHVTPEIAHARKPEHDISIIEQKCNNIKKLTFPNALIIDVDATKPYQEVLLNIKREIWKNL